MVDYLNSRLESRLREDEVLRIFYDVCQAVSHLHSFNPPIIHRDIKVENLLIAADGTFKLCDFGSCTTNSIMPGSTNMKELRDLEDDISRHTTLQYRAPEICDLYQRKGMDEKVDIWALGVLLYKLCYFTTPFEEGGKLSILNAKITIPDFPHYSTPLKNLIYSLIQIDIDKRLNIYQTVASVCTLRNIPYNLKIVSTLRLVFFKDVNS